VRVPNNAGRRFESGGPQGHGGEGRGPRPDWLWLVPASKPVHISAVGGGVLRIASQKWPVPKRLLEAHRVEFAHFVVGAVAGGTKHDRLDHNARWVLFHLPPPELRTDAPAVQRLDREVPFVRCLGQMPRLWQLTTFDRLDVAVAGNRGRGCEEQPAQHQDPWAVPTSGTLGDGKGVVMSRTCPGTTQERLHPLRRDDSMYKPQEQQPRSRPVGWCRCVGAGVCGSTLSVWLRR